MQIWRKITRLAITLATFATLTSTASASCEGTDLRAGLNPQERMAIDAKIAATPYASGNHWRAVRGGQVIHLIGTIHLNDARLDPITERLRGVIEASDLLLLEMGPEEEEALKSDMVGRPELLFLQEQTLPALLSEADWQDLAAAMKARGVPPMIASRFQPWYLSVMLGMPPCLAEQLMGDGALGLDNRLRDIALGAGVPVRGLEPHDTLFTLFGDEPIEDQIDVMLLGLETQDQSLDMMQTVIAAYYDESHAQAWEMSRHAVMQIKSKPAERLRELFAQMEEDLLIARNVAWIPVILDALEGHRQITIAAGAGHLAGEAGVLALLEAEGFTLERLPF